MSDAIDGLGGLWGREVNEAGPAAWETTNLLTLSTALAQAARLRAETRGSHWREDFPLRDDEEWAGHVDLRLVEDELELEFVPSPATDLAKEPS